MTTSSNSSNFSSWVIRGACTGLALDIIHSLVCNRFEFIYTAIGTIHGVALGILGMACGNPPAVMAFICSSAFLFPAALHADFFLEEGIIRSIKASVASTLFGAALGSVL